MKIKHITLITSLLVTGILSSCLEGDEMNTPPGAVQPFIIMTNNPDGGPLVNSGIRYFGSQALLLDPTIENDTISFAVAIQGTRNFGRDINVTLQTPVDALDDYFATDGIPYEMLPAEGYDFISTSGKIKTGETYTEFKVVLHPSVIDLTKNYMLPITATNDAGLATSSNYGFVYYHIIGNPLAGQYTWSYRRYNNADTVGATAGTVNDVALFAPKDGTTIETLGGYGATVGINCPYVLTFKNTNGVLSDFHVTIDPDLVGGLTENGITITIPPIIIDADYTETSRHFKFMFQVHNGTANRTLIDEYWLP